jgi:Tol biopolymer transport system component
LHLTWSPDGNWFTGTANGLGPVQGIAKLNATTGEIIGISERERYNCTPDWMPDSKRVLYARGIVPGTRVGGPDGWAQLGVAGGGEKPRVLYAEEGQHVYHACSSPDGKYLLFTRTEDDAHGSPRSKMALIRYADTPLVAPDDRVSQARYPEAKRGPRLDLPRGWEPHWTYTDIAHPKERKP